MRGREKGKVRAIAARELTTERKREKQKDGAE